MSATRRGTFGERLRRLREEADLTQEELASRAGLTAKGISALERGERRRPYPHTLRAISDALNLPEEERDALVRSVSRRDAAPSPVTALPVPSAPPTALIGREREVEEVGGLLYREENRLLTLTGPGGIGKTRLALEVARDADGDFGDGVAFVALAPLGSAEFVMPAVSQVLGLSEAVRLSPLDAVCAHLREKRLLLVLDNVEHVLGAAPEVAALVEACGGVTVLSTSRAPLRVRGEQEYPVQPLGLPASTRDPAVGEVAGSPSGRLFLERARAALPTFELDRDNAGAVAAICWRLDGLPLALELAAARARFLDPAALLVRLDRALSAGWARDLPERQRTMQAALDWSHDLLSEDEKVLFRRLSVFAGGFGLEAAENVGAAGDDVIDLLGRLVEQSMVLAEPTGEMRYRMLEPVRQYALEKLEHSGEAEDVRRRHAGYYLALAERAGPRLKGPDQGPWVRRLLTDLDNLRAAMGWAIGHGGAEAVAEMAWTTWTFWWTSGNLKEGRRWMEAALAVEPEPPAPVRARLLFVASTLGQALGDFDASRPLVEESQALFERLGDRRGIGMAMGTAGLVALGQGHPERGLSLMEECINLYLEIGEKWGAAAMLGFSATVPFARGDMARARQLAERGLSLAREVGARDVIYVSLYPLAAIAFMEGDHDRARPLFEEGMRMSFEVGEKVNAALCMEGLAALAAAEDETARAARLWGAAEAFLEDVEIIAYPYAADRSLRDRGVAAARDHLDARTWAEAWAEGRDMTEDQAIRYALEGDA